MKNIAPIGRRTFVGGLVASAIPALAQDAAADFPAKPIRLIHPYPPGGITDAIARIVTTEMATALGKPVIIENTPGASGNIAVEKAMRAPADGYSLGFYSTAQVTALATRPNSSPNVARQVAPVVMMTRSILVMVIPKSLGVDNLADFVKLVRANPGKFFFGNPGVGSGHHLLIESFKRAAGIDMPNVLYKGEAPILLDLAAGRVHMTFTPAPQQFLDTGKIIAIAVSADEAWPAFPTLPTMRSVAPQTMKYYAWSGLFAPAGTPPAIVARLNQAANQALKTEQVRSALIKLGVQPAGGTTAEIGGQVGEDLAAFRKVAVEQKLQIED